MALLMRVGIYGLLPYGVKELYCSEKVEKAAWMHEVLVECTPITVIW